MKTKTVRVDELTEKQRKIVAYLYQQCTPCTPTEIGIHVGGKCYGQASSWACSTLKRLTEMGITERNRRGHYAIRPTVEVPAELVEVSDEMDKR